MTSASTCAADTAVRMAWLNSLKSDGRASDLSARLNKRSRYYDPALRYIYDNLSSTERGLLSAISKEPRATRTRRRRSQPRKTPVTSSGQLVGDESGAIVPSASTYAVLVDAENVNWHTIQPVMAKIGAEYGDARIRRMYGDFSAANLAPWAEVERTYSFMMVHQGALVKGKGCSDVLMAADAMELRYENDVIDGYCIVSSDSDFAPLVKRLREAGKHVVGFGKASTPRPFQQACHAFVVTDDLDWEPALASTPPSPTVIYRTLEEHVSPEMEHELFDIVNTAAAEAKGGWCVLPKATAWVRGACRVRPACLGSPRSVTRLSLPLPLVHDRARLATVERMLLARRNDFDVRKWGAAHLSDLLNSSRCSVRGEELNVWSSPCEYSVTACSRV